MKKIVATFSLTLLAACGSHTSSSSNTAGAPHAFSALCTSKDTDTSFRIYEGKGMLLQYGRPTTSFNCEQIVSLGDGEFVNSPARMLYECNEADQTDGAQIAIYRTHIGGEVLASMTAKKGGDEIAKLTCQP